MRSYWRKEKAIDIMKRIKNFRKRKAQVIYIEGDGVMVKARDTQRIINIMIYPIL